MKQLIIGDIHGCYEELQDLLDKVGLASSDEIIAIGDIVDRGRDSTSALRFFQQTPNARSIYGNHERKHVRSFRGEIEPAASQIITRHQIGEKDAEAAYCWHKAQACEKKGDLGAAFRSMQSCVEIEQLNDLPGVAEHLEKMRQLKRKLPV